MDYEIRTLTTVEDFTEHERLQREIWGSDQIDVPVNLLTASARHGGVLLGAFIKRRMVGILYGFPALTNGRFHHHSHMLGVLPPYRRLGIVLALKLRQREIVRAQGLDEITWTVDPLEVGNNVFNFGRLGVVCDTYIVDAYGEMVDALNRGLPSDRLEVRWRVHEDLPRAPRLIPLNATLLTTANMRRDGLPEPRRVAELAGVACLITAPREYRTVQRTDSDLALRWRLHLRRDLTEAFEAGYLLTGCVEYDGQGCYLLSKPKV